MVRVRSLATAMTVLLACALLISGCSKKSAEVTSAWPVARSERSVPKPSEPAVWPLSGKPAPDAVAITRRPLSIKIENSPSARPQSGLNEADVVYETLAEGGITRFNCIFQSDLVKSAGPVRSARLSDMWIVPQYRGLFFFSGSSDSVERAIRSNKLPNLSPDVGVSYPYSRSRARSAPHNLYLDTKKAYQEATKRKMSIVADVPRLQFATPSEAATPTISSIYIPFSQANTVLWTYSPNSRAYLRENGGRKHFDAAVNKQVAATNVVVMWAKYTPASHDKVGSVTYNVALGGSGRASVFTGGQRTDGTWTATRNMPPRFKDGSGKAIKLAPGNTWFQVITLSTNITMK